MTPKILSLALWIPFLIVALITGIIFAVSGYKKGLWRALIGLGATLVAAALSMLLANYVSSLLAPTVLNILPDMGLEEAGMAEGLVTALVQGVIQCVLAMVLFSLFLFILTILLRAISARIKKDALLPDSTGKQYGGMLVGLGTAVIFALLLLLPLYGSLAAYGPTAESLLHISQGEEAAQDPAAEYLKAVNQHPIVRVSASAPLAAVYEGTTRISLGENGSVSVAEAATVLQEASGILEDLVHASEEDRPEKCQELIRYLRTNVAQQEWAYMLAMEGVQQLKSATPELDETGRLYWDQLLGILDISQPEFEENACALLDFGELVLERDGYTILEDMDYDRLYSSGIVGEAGKLANFSPQAVAVKNLLMMQCAAQLCGEDQQAISGFMNRYSLEEVTDPQSQKQEAEALMLLMGFGNGSPAEFILRHPSLGEPVLEEVIRDHGFSAAMGFTSDYQQELAALVDADPAIQAALLEQLKDHAGNPLDGTTFQDSCDVLLALSGFAKEGYLTHYFTCSADSLSFALETLGQEAFTSGALSAGAETYTFLSCYPAWLEDREDSRYYDIPGSAEAMGQLMSAIKDGEIPTEDRDYYTDSHYLLSQILHSEIAVGAAEMLVAQRGADPLGLGSYLSSAQKRWMADRLESLVEEQNAYGNNFYYYPEEGFFSTNTDGSGMSFIITDGDGFSSAGGGMSVVITDGNSLVIGEDRDGLATDGGTEQIYSYEERLTHLKAFFGLG